MERAGSGKTHGQMPHLPFSNDSNTFKIVVFGNRLTYVLPFHTYIKPSDAARTVLNC